MKACLLLLAVFLLTAPGPVSGENRWAEALAVITRVQGTVEVRKANEASWFPARVGTAIGSGDSVRTAPGASATLLFSDDRQMTMQSASEVQFSGTTAEKVAGVTKVLKGLWKALLSKLDTSEDVSVRRGVVGASRAPKREEVLRDASLPPDQAKELRDQTEELLELSPVESDAAFLLAILYEERGQFRKAEEAYLRAIEASPTEARLYDALIDLYLKARAPNKAKETLERRTLMGAQ